MGLGTKAKIAWLVAIVLVSMVISNWVFDVKRGKYDRETKREAGLETIAKPLAGPRKLRELYDSVRTYVIFLGHARSGHSLVGSLLDAHPEVIVTHEYGTEWNLFHQGAEKEPNWSVKKRSFYYGIHDKSFNQAMFGLRANKPPKQGTNHSYNYHVHGQWQGQYRDKITVMGDKSGHVTADYFKNPMNMVQLEHIQKNLGVSLKIIHVLRNPFDVLATQVLRSSHTRDSASEESKVDQTDNLERLIKKYFERAAVIERIGQKYFVLEVLGHELVQRPKNTMQKLCDFVGITCEDDYIDACADLLYGEPSITRNLIKWTDDEKRRTQEEINKYSFLKRYSFDSYP